MMGNTHCHAIQRQLMETLAPEELVTDGDLGKHLRTCEACRAIHHDLVLLRGAAQAIEPALLPDGFELGLRRALRDAAQTATPKPLTLRAGRPRVRRIATFAAAAGLLLAGGLVGLRAALTHRSTPQGAAGRVVAATAPQGAAVGTVAAGPSPPLAAAPAAPEVRAPLRLRFVARAPHAARGATFDLRLAPGVELPPELKQLATAGSSLRWHGDLVPGENVVELPVLAAPARAGARPDGQGPVAGLSISDDSHAPLASVGEPRLMPLEPAALPAFASKTAAVLQSPRPAPAGPTGKATPLPSPPPGAAGPPTRASLPPAGSVGPPAGLPAGSAATKVPVIDLSGPLLREPPKGSEVLPAAKDRPHADPERFGGHGDRAKGRPAGKSSSQEHGMRPEEMMQHMGGMTPEGHHHGSGMSGPGMQGGGRMH